MGPLPKNSDPNTNRFWFWRGVTLGSPQTSPLGQILGTCLLSGTPYLAEFQHHPYVAIP